MADPTLPPPLPLGAPTAPPPGLTLQDGARLVGHHVWLETRLFEVLGGWVQSVPEPEVKAHLATHSRRHAWHAELWHGHLPDVADIDADSLVAPPGDRADEALAALAEPEPTIERLTGLYRVVLPRLVTATSRVLARTSAVADAALARSLRFVLGDDLDEWRDGEALLQALLTGPDEIDRATAHQAQLEKLVVALMPTLAPPGS
ncbi:MAG TPA: hypothetical protein VIL48_18810 [Acidimicrobiales bacterium]